MPKIPCTLSILTRNSAEVLPAALASAQDFAEIIIADGGSTDDTVEIARKAGARVLAQERRFQDSSGRISDFAGVRNQTLAASTQDWFFFLDSDELMTPQLISEIRSIVSLNKPAAYWVNRLYTIKGKVISCAATYPTWQMRFFHKSTVVAFIKPIHERIQIKPHALVQKTKQFMLVPVSSDPMIWREKWKHYIDLEITRRTTISFIEWIGVCAENAKISALYIFRYVRNSIFCSGTRMPWALEWERHVYHWDLCRNLLVHALLAKRHR